MRKTLGKCNIRFCSLRLQLQISSNHFSSITESNCSSVRDWNDCWLETFQVWRQGQVRPCSGEVMSCSTQPSPGVYPSPISHWHTEDNAPCPTSEASHPDPKWPPDWISHLRKGTQESQRASNLKCKARMCIHPTSSWNFCQLNTDGTRIGSYVFPFLYVLCLSLSSSNSLLSGFRMI